MKNNKGITLIALVITIIVMLILVAVTIRVATTGNLFSHAANAVKGTRKTADEENAILNGDGLSIEDIVAEQTGIQISDAGLLGGVKVSKNTPYRSDGKTAIIPAGFMVSGISTEQSISEGLVIYDPGASDTIDWTNPENARKNYNQFVWIPVDDISKFVTTEWERYTGNEIDFNSSENIYDNVTTEEYIAMKNSVQNNHGFYIARYEAGTTIERVSGGTNSTPAPAYSKKLLYPYNFVYWEDAESLSKGMYTGSSYGVKSTLCYGVQWDQTLRFIKDRINVTDCNDYGNYISHSFSYEGRYYSPNEPVGWYDNTATKSSSDKILLQTGASDANKVKNIYDLAGNVGEFTMEESKSGTSTYKIWRGATYGHRYGGPSADMMQLLDTSYNPVSGRWSYSIKYPSLSDYYGFRPALYVTTNN